MYYSSGTRVSLMCPMKISFFKSKSGSCYSLRDVDSVHTECRYYVVSYRGCTIFLKSNFSLKLCIETFQKTFNRLWSNISKMYNQYYNRMAKKSYINMKIRIYLWKWRPDLTLFDLHRHSGADSTEWQCTQYWHIRNQHEIIFPLVCEHSKKNKGVRPPFLGMFLPVLGGFWS